MSETETPAGSERRTASVRLVLRYDVPRDEREAGQSLVELSAKIADGTDPAPHSVELLQPLLGGEVVTYELHLSFASHTAVGAWIDRLENEVPERDSKGPGHSLAELLVAPGDANVQPRGEDGWPAYRVLRWERQPETVATDTEQPPPTGETGSPNEPPRPEAEREGSPE